jgi:hypothetical protein
MLIMAIVMFSLSMVLINSLVDTAYNRQRNQAVSLANQTIEELRALGWPTIRQGMAATDLTGDGNVVNGCFEDQALDFAGIVGPQSACLPQRWVDPSCLSGAGVALPTAAALVSPAPLDPHQQCYNVNGHTYGIDVYLTGGTGAAVPPLTATVVVSWAHPVRNGLSDHIVTTTEISSCLTDGINCT